MSFFPLQKLKGTQPTKTPTVRAVHLEEEGSDKQADTISKDPDEIVGVTEEFIVCLARVVKGAQRDEKCGYHCNSTEHFIHECLLVKASRSATNLNQKKGTGLGPWSQDGQAKDTPGGDTPSKGHHKQTSFFNLNPFFWWNGVENVAKVRINGESCMALLDNGAQRNMITPNFVKESSFDIEPLTDLLGGWVACVGLGSVLTWSLGYGIIWVQLDGVQGYDEDQIALVILDMSNFVVRVPVILGTPTISHVINVKKEKEIDTLGKHLSSLSPGTAMDYSYSRRW